MGARSLDKARLRTITSETRNHGYDVTVAESYLLITWSPSQTCHAKPKTQINRPWRCLQLLPAGGMPTASSLPERLLSEKSGRCGIAALPERGAFTLIDRHIRQAIDRCSNIWASLPGAGYGQFEHKADSLIAKFKEAGGTAGERLMASRVTAIISALAICIIVCLSWAVNHYRDNAITYKAQRDKMPENCYVSLAITDMQMRQRDAAALDAKYTMSRAMLKLPKMMLCVMMLPLVVVGCTSKQSVSQCVKPPPPPAWIMQLDWQTPLNGIISPSERGWSLCKNNWKEPRSTLMSSGMVFAHIDGNGNYCEQYTRASSGV